MHCWLHALREQIRPGCANQSDSMVVSLTGQFLNAPPHAVSNHPNLRCLPKKPFTCSHITSESTCFFRGSCFLEYTSQNSSNTITTLYAYQTTQNQPPNSQPTNQPATPSQSKEEPAFLDWGNRAYPFCCPGLLPP